MHIQIKMSSWINYLGLLKLTRLSRQLHRQSEEQIDLKYIIQLGDTPKVNTKVLVSSQAALMQWQLQH